MHVLHLEFKTLIMKFSDYLSERFFLNGILWVAVLAIMASAFQTSAQEKSDKVQVGAYYFDGWAGKNRHADDPNEPWAKDAPSHLTRRMVEEFSEREPVWGWRDDAQEIMERQIDLAADNGIDFFLFCWYWRDSNGPINREAIEKLSLHSSLNLYLKAKNKHRIKFSLLVANHGGSEIKGAENWAAATKFWMPYFKDSQFVRVDGKPLVVIFSSGGVDNVALAGMQSVARESGLPGLSIAGCGNTAEKDFTHRTHYNIVPGYAAGSEEHPYSELVDAHKKQWKGTEQQPYIPTLTVGWDKRPWESPTGLNQKLGYYYPNRTPKDFHGFLSDAVTWMDQNPTQTTKERVLLIYAWNELGEGGYLVPTKGDKKASYLKTVKRVVRKTN
jgi:hypothetical protein